MNAGNSNGEGAGKIQSRKSQKCPAPYMAHGSSFDAGSLPPLPHQSPLGAQVLTQARRGPQQGTAQGRATPATRPHDPPMLGGILDWGAGGGDNGLSKSDNETDLGSSCSNRRSLAEKPERTLPEHCLGTRAPSSALNPDSPGRSRARSSPSKLPACVCPRALPVQTVHHPGHTVPKGPNP